MCTYCFQLYYVVFASLIILLSILFVSELEKSDYDHQFVGRAGNICISMTIITYRVNWGIIRPLYLGNKSLLDEEFFFVHSLRVRVIESEHTAILSYIEPSSTLPSILYFRCVGNQYAPLYIVNLYISTKMYSFFFGIHLYF